ncbi:MAG: hypothetical protein WCA16_08895, partial [Candidatus Sulfotelmatobacter sp.]
TVLGGWDGEMKKNKKLNAHMQNQNSPKATNDSRVAPRSGLLRPETNSMERWPSTTSSGKLESRSVMMEVNRTCQQDNKQELQGSHFSL